MESNHRLACVHTPFVNGRQTERFKKLHAFLLSVETVPVVRYLLALPVFSLPPVGSYANCALWLSNTNENFFDSERMKRKVFMYFFFKHAAFKSIIVFKNHSLQFFSREKELTSFSSLSGLFH